MEEDGAIPPPPQSSTDSNVQGQNPAGSSASTMSNTPSAGSATSAPVPDPLEDLTTSFQKFVKTKFMDFLQKKSGSLSVTQKMEIIKALTDVMHKEFGLTDQQTIRSAKAGVAGASSNSESVPAPVANTGNEPKAGPQAPQAS